jgi:hypothetical protein
MKVHPILAAAAMLPAAVLVLGASAVVRHHRARARRPAPPLEVEEAPPAPRHIYPMAEAPPVRPPPAPAPPPRAELHVHVTGPHGLLPSGVDVSFHRHGAPPDVWDLLDEEDDDEAGEAPGGDTVRRNGRLSSKELEPGRYDLRVEAEGMRPLHLDDVATGPKVIEVALARAPVLLGNAGAMATDGCEGLSVGWAAPVDDGEAGEATVDYDDCTFAIEGLPAAGPITVTATLGATKRSVLVTPPLSGDPAYVCLEPPCGAEPATLLVYLADTEHHPIDDASLTWTLRRDEYHGAMGTSTGASLLYVHNRRVGETLDLRLERDKQVVTSTATLGPGVTEVLLTLPFAPPKPSNPEQAVADGHDVDDAAPHRLADRDRLAIIRDAPR